MHESRHLQLSSLEGRVDSVEGGIAKAAPHTKQGEETYLFCNSAKEFSLGRGGEHHRASLLCERTQPLPSPPIAGTPVLFTAHPTI